MFTPSGMAPGACRTGTASSSSAGHCPAPRQRSCNCEDRDLVASTPEAILARIKAEYRPYDSFAEFQEGFDAYQKDGAFRRPPYDGVKAQAWDRGANAATLYARTLPHLDAHKEDVEKAGPGWLARLLRTRRC